MGSLIRPDARTPPPTERRQLSPRRVLRRVVAIVIALVAVLAASVAGILAPYYLALALPQTALLALGAVLSFSVVSGAGLRAAAALWRPRNPTHAALVTSGGLAVVFFALLYIFILRSHPLRYAEVIPAENAHLWHLPTGSTISYQEYLPPSGVAIKPEPIVFLHGGPGLRFAPFDSDIYRRFAADGFRVYLYDQAGSGASGLLPHIRDYSVARAVEDLDAVRGVLHAERMILIGHSFGSTLAASYMAKYPTHVSKVVFHSPGNIWNLPDAHFDFGRTEAGSAEIGLASIPPRLIAALFLMQQNPDAAEHLLSQREAEDLWGPVMARTAETLVCKGHSASIPPLILGIENERDSPGFNPYVLQRLIDQTAVSSSDPHAALKDNSTPAILLFGECNYIPWKVTVDYRHTFSDLKVFYFPGAGHYVQFDSAPTMTSVIRDFLLDQPNAVLPHSGDDDPRLPTRRSSPSREPTGA